MKSLSEFSFRSLVLPGLFLMFLGLTVSAFAEEGTFALYPEIGRVQDSDAYKQYLLRPRSEYSKLLFLIDRLGSVEVDVLYDGIHYKMDFIAPFARIFLSRNYHNETAQDWVMKWCNRSIRLSELIWVDLPNKKVKLAREILGNELKALDDAVAQEKTPPPAEASSAAGTK